MRKLISFLLLSFVAYTLQAQIKDPVKFKTELNSLSDTEAEIVFTAAIDKGWHVYSTDLGDGGPISATFNVEKKSGVELVGKLHIVSFFFPLTCLFVLFTDFSHASVFWHSVFHKNVIPTLPRSDICRPGLQKLPLPLLNPHCSFRQYLRPHLQNKHGLL